MSPMETNVEGSRCSFCAKPGVKGMRFGAGYGVMICEDCVGHYHDVFTSTSTGKRATASPWESMTDAEVLDTLPLISQTADQVTEVLVEWVDVARSRKLSWAEIGKALGVSRQAAWERFSHRVDSGRKAVETA